MTRPPPDLTDPPSGARSGVLGLIGAGGHARVVAEAARAAGFDVTAAFAPSPAPGARLGDAPVLDVAALASRPDLPLHVAVGDNAARRRIVESEAPVGAEWRAVVHPTARLSPSAVVAPGALVGMGAHVQAAAVIGPHAIVNTAAVVEHDATVGAFAHVGPAAVLCGGVHVGEGVLIGAGAVVLPGVRLGQGARVGAGAVVTRDVTPGAVVAGSPARAAALSQGDSE